MDLNKLYTHKFRVKNDGVIQYESIRPYTFTEVGVCQVAFDKYKISALYKPFIRGNNTDKGWINTPRWYKSDPAGIDYIEIGFYDRDTEHMVVIMYNPFMDNTKLISII